MALIVKRDNHLASYILVTLSLLKKRSYRESNIKKRQIWDLIFLSIAVVAKPH
jgi:hypothetical protein